MNTNGAKPLALWAYDLFLANKEMIWKAEIFIGMEFGSKLALQKDLSSLEVTVLYGVCKNRYWQTLVA